MKKYLISWLKNTSFLIKVITLVVIAFFTRSLQAQESTLLYYFENDSVIIKKDQTFVNQLIIENLSDTAVDFTLQHHFVHAGFLPLPTKGTVPAMGKISYPVKFLTDLKTILSNYQKFEVELRIGGQQGAPKPMMANFVAVLDDVVGLYLDVQEQEIYLSPRTNDAELEIRIFNNGLIPIDFKLVLKEIPKGLLFEPLADSLMIGPGKQLLIPLRAKRLQQGSRPEDFAVNIQAVDLNGKQLAAKNMRIMSLSSNRNLVLAMQDVFYQNRPNSVLLNYVNGEGYNAMQLVGSGKYVLDRGREWGYNLNFNYYLNAGTYTLNDTYAYYKDTKWAVHVGSIYKNLDFNVSGKGLKGSYFLGAHKALHVYALDNNFTLASTNHRLRRSGHTLAAEYVDGIPDHEKTAIKLLYHKDEFEALHAYLVSAKQNILKTNKQTLRLEGGLSTERESLNGRNHQGFAAAVNYQIHLPNVQFNSYHYYSSPYYTGIRQGLTQADNSITFRLEGNQSIYFNSSYSVNKARNFAKQWNAFVSQVSHYRQQKYQMGYLLNFRERWSMGFSPYYFQQDMVSTHAAEITTETTGTSKSLRFKTQLNYAIERHSLMLSIDNGYTFKNTKNKPSGPFSSTRIQANYRSALLGVNVFYQHNPYYMSDALANGSTSDYDVLSLGPTMSFVAFDQKLSVNSSLMYSYYGYNKSQNYVLNMYGRLNLKADWALTAEIYMGINRWTSMTQYNPETGLNFENPTVNFNDASLYTSRQVKIGVEKKIGSVQNTKEKKLILTYFEDLNNNGVHDADEEVVPGILVKINGLAAISNKKGTVTFTAPVAQSYAPTISNMDGWNVSALAPNEVFLTKDQQIAIPLVKTERLAGEISFTKELYLSDEISLSGLKVVAENEQGVFFRTSSNNIGKFNLYLPEDTYKVYIEDADQPLKVLDNMKLVTIVKGKSRSVHFESIDNRRKVEIMKF